MTSYESIVDEIVGRYGDAELPMMGFGTVDEEVSYLRKLKESYVRTIRDVDALWRGEARTEKKILEIGSFLGVVSFSLKRMGYDVSALDIPEFNQVEQTRNAYSRNGVDYSGVNLRHGKLPFENERFNAVVACEIFEHFNFNPLPVLAEISRVLKLGGYLYVAMPNQAHLPTRIRALLGHSVRDPVSAYFKQLDKNENKMVAIHWREYTLSETVEMISAMGFEVVRTYYFSEYGSPKFQESKFKRNLYCLFKRAVFVVPSFRKSQVVIARKVDSPKFDFWLTEANS